MTAMGIVLVWSFRRELERVMVHPGARVLRRVVGGIGLGLGDDRIGAASGTNRGERPGDGSVVAIDIDDGAGTHGGVIGSGERMALMVAP
jgi:hypothetical protein